MDNKELRRMNQRDEARERRRKKRRRVVLIYEKQNKGESVKELFATRF